MNGNYYGNLKDAIILNPAIDKYVSCQQESNKFADFSSMTFDFKGIN